MFKIEDEKIYITRGDKATIELTIDDYTFNVGDTVEFKVYNKGKLNQAPVLTKKIEVKDEADAVNINLLSEETKIGEPANKPVEYWYEIELNNDQTIIGYDENKEKILVLYPEGVEVNA